MFIDVCMDMCVDMFRDVCIHIRIVMCCTTGNLRSRWFKLMPT